jgi:uncharacterized membrane protein YhaH (DUF805 family)
MSAPPIVSLLFGLRAPVSRQTYLVAGCTLMAMKYGVDASIARLLTGSFWMPWSYFNPVFSMRDGALELAPGTAAVFSVAMLVWALPFLWVGASMSVRRAIDAGLAPTLGLLFFVPFVNFAMIALFCVLPSAPPRSIPADAPGSRSGVQSVLLGLGLTTVLAVGMTLLSTFVAAEYGAALFLGTPFAAGFFVAWLLNGPRPVSIGATLAAMTVALLTAGGALMLFALEGLLCLVMAFPIGWMLGLLGALLGRGVAIAGHTRATQAASVVLILPALLAFEAANNRPPEREVITSIEVDAPPQAVWNNVVGWAELPSDNLPWYFAMGVAYPQRARLEGRGVGAVRYCEFSTGAFVEPITVWDEPRRLSFDVAAQPASMHEWSPWERVHAPHLDGYIVSHRGEFRLVDLGGGRTRLEGSTWYHLDMWPQVYWTRLSDALLHGIHQRVLDHVAALAEAEAHGEGVPRH